MLDRRVAEPRRPAKIPPRGPGAETDSASAEVQPGAMPSLTPDRPPPPGEPDWALHARQLAESLAWVAQLGTETPAHLLAAIDRAWDAWHAGGFTAKEIAAVARLVERARAAIRAVPEDESQSAYLLCAQVMYQGLPRRIKASAQPALLVQIVREMQQESIESVARRRATMRVLGWQDTAQRWADRIIALSLATQRK